MPRITTGEIWTSSTSATGCSSPAASPRPQQHVEPTPRSVQPARTWRRSTSTPAWSTPPSDPTFDGGGVTEIEASPDGTKLFVVGRFNTVNGVTKRKVASINPTTGATVTGFTANANGPATSVEATNTTVYVGGQFTTVNGTARSRPRGASTPPPARSSPASSTTSPAASASTAPSPCRRWCSRHDGTKLLVVHTGRQIAGQDRYGIALINTADQPAAAVAHPPVGRQPAVRRRHHPHLRRRHRARTTSTSWSPAAPAATARRSATPSSPTRSTAATTSQPLWISRASTASTRSRSPRRPSTSAATSTTTSHRRRRIRGRASTDVGYGRGQGLAGYGLGDDIVIRDHVGALDPVDGKALEWNPGSNSFEGNKAMLATPRGIITGGDATTQGGAERRPDRVLRLQRASRPSAPTRPRSSTRSRVGSRRPTCRSPSSGTRRPPPAVCSRVQVEVRDRDTGQYLQDNLTTWGGGNTINATLASPDATATPTGRCR